MKQRLFTRQLSRPPKKRPFAKRKAAFRLIDLGIGFPWWREGRLKDMDSREFPSLTQGQWVN